MKTNFMRRLMKWSLPIGLAICILPLVCQKLAEEDFTLPNAKTSRHSNGLVVPVPSDYVVETTRSGLIVGYKDNDNMRIPIEIDVSLVKGNRNTLKNALLEKEVSGKTISYSLVEGEGGSGGASYDLVAYETLGNNFIKYEQSTQSEHSPPDFEMFWKIVANTQFKP